MTGSFPKTIPDIPSLIKDVLQRRQTRPIQKLLWQAIHLRNSVLQYLFLFTCRIHLLHQQAMIFTRSNGNFSQL